MKLLCCPVSYSIRGKINSVFSFVKKNKTTATYEIRITDTFAFRVYLPLVVAEKLSPDSSIPKEIALLVCLPENLETCQIASFEEFPTV